MPALVLNRILNDCDIRAIFSLRKVCRDLHDFIDEAIPCIHLTYIQVEVRIHEICLILSNDQEIITIRYQHNDGNGCTVKFNDTNHLLDEENFIEIFAKDLSLILKHQSPKTVLEVFSFQCWDHEDWYERQRGQRSWDCLSVIDNDGAECLMKPLIEQIAEEIPEQRIAARALETYGIFPRHTKAILKLFRAGTLKTIKIYDPHRIRIENNEGYTSDEDYLLGLDEIYDLEQWKQADELTTRGFHVARGVPIDGFGGFSRGNVFIRDFSAEGIARLCEIFLQSPNFENFTVTMPLGPHSNFFVSQPSETWKAKLIKQFGEPSNFLKFSKSDDFMTKSSIGRENDNQKNLRNFIDDVIPAIQLTRIKIEVDAKTVCLTIANRQENIKSTYEKSTAKTLANDLELFIKFQKSDPLNIVKLEWRDTDFKLDGPLDDSAKEKMLEMECNERQSMMDPLVEALNEISAAPMMNVKILETVGVFPWEVKPLLKLCRPGTLSCIRLSSPHRSKFVTFDCSDDPEDYSVDLDEIQELEQWKQAEVLNILGFCVPPQVSVASYAHFLKGVVFVRKLTVEDIFYLSQTFVESPNFDFFTITIPRCKNYSELREVDWITELNKKFGAAAEISQDPDHSNIYDWVVRSPERALQLRYYTPNTFNFTVKEE
ncbi:hypothetical protein CRE_15671 [Caenorhabditis remanei]|uniref:F-box domain-containing protein n=1 Tax=Caenorhabditis remanei TaxID=31234 RepID=E3N891_CAERE|nr:hypothetical protein CRE_15671 [Caenorhabditis remanei]